MVGRRVHWYAAMVMGLAFYIPWRWFEPLPEWAVPWFVAGLALGFVFVVIWAIGKHMEEPVRLAPDGHATVNRGGEVSRWSLVLATALAVVVFFLWVADPFG